jgi:hypothetical protein
VTFIRLLGHVFLYGLSNKMRCWPVLWDCATGIGSRTTSRPSTRLLLESVVPRKSRVSLLRAALVQRLAAQPCETFREYDRCFHPDHHSLSPLPALIRDLPTSAAQFPRATRPLLPFPFPFPLHHPPRIHSPRERLVP